VSSTAADSVGILQQSRQLGKPLQQPQQQTAANLATEEIIGDQTLNFALKFSKFLARNTCTWCNMSRMKQRHIMAESSLSVQYSRSLPKALGNVKQRVRHESAVRKQHSCTVTSVNIFDNNSKSQIPLLEERQTIFNRRSANTESFHQQCKCHPRYSKSQFVR